VLPGAAGGDGGDGAGFAGEGDGPAAALARFPVQKVNYELGEEIGWPSQVALTVRAYDSLPAPERAGAAVVAGNYGEAGAVALGGGLAFLPRLLVVAGPGWTLGEALAAGRRVVAGDAGELGQQPGRGEHPQQRLRLP
jgi:hypothetical protein